MNDQINTKKIRIFSTGGPDLVKDLQILLRTSFHAQLELPHAHLWEPGSFTFAVLAVFAEEIISKIPTEGYNAGVFYILLHKQVYSNMIPKVPRLLIYTVSDSSPAFRSSEAIGSHQSK